MHGAYTCDCTPDYTGTNCGITLFPCDGRPCMNGGTCIDAGLGDRAFSCECATRLVYMNIVHVYGTFMSR